MTEAEERERQEILDTRRLFSGDLGQQVLRSLMIKFGYNEPDFEDNDNILSVKPHERRGMKMPLKHIMFCMGANVSITKPNSHEKKGQVTFQENRNQEDSEESTGQEGGFQEGVNRFGA